MAVSIRLARRGKKKQPHYFIIVQDKEKSPKGAYLEKLGYYDPRTDPLTLKIDQDKVQAWLDKGAEISEAAARLFEIAKGEGPQPKKEKKKLFGKHREQQADGQEAPGKAEAAPAEEVNEEKAPEQPETAAEEPETEEKPEEEEKTAGESESAAAEHDKAEVEEESAKEDQEQEESEEEQAK